MKFSVFFLIIGVAWVSLGLLYFFMGKTEVGACCLGIAGAYTAIAGLETEKQIHFGRNKKG